MTLANTALAAGISLMQTDHQWEISDKIRKVWGLLSWDTNRGEKISGFPFWKEIKRRFYAYLSIPSSLLHICCTESTTFFCTPCLSLK